MRIDVHTHLMPLPLFRKVWDLGGFDEIAVYQRSHKYLGPSPEQASKALIDQQDLDQRVKDMDEGGIDVQIISLGSGQPYFKDEKKGTEAAVVANDCYQGFHEAHPTRFGIFGMIPLPHVAASLREIDRCFDELDFSGIGLGCSTGDRPLDDPAFELIWTKLNERRAVVYLHPGVNNTGIIGSHEHHLSADFVSPAEVSVAVARLILAGIPQRYPDIDFVIATLGGNLPFLGKRYDHGLYQDSADDYAALGGFSPHLRRLYYDASVLEEPIVLRAAVEAFGVERLMMGSDWPRPHTTIHDAPNYILDADFLSDADKERILDINAVELLKDRLPASILTASRAG